MKHGIKPAEPRPKIFRVQSVFHPWLKKFLDHAMRHQFGVSLVGFDGCHVSCGSVAEKDAVSPLLAGTDFGGSRPGRRNFGTL